MIIKVLNKENKKILLYIFFLSFILIDKKRIESVGIVDSEQIYTYVTKKTIGKRFFADKLEMCSNSDIVFDFSNEIFSKDKILFINHTDLINETNNTDFHREGLNIVYDYIYKFRDNKSKININSIKKSNGFGLSICSIKYNMKINNMLAEKINENDYFLLYKNLNKKAKKNFDQVSEIMRKEYNF